MHLENTFAVDAPADQVFEFMLDVNRILGCVPGAELSDIVDDRSFRGRMRIRVGAASIAYPGNGHVVSQDDAAHTAVLEAEGRETGGSGTARAVIGVRVDEGVSGAEVTLVIDLTVVGRASQFGQGVLAEVGRGLLAQTATCIAARLTEPQIPLPIPILGAERDEPPSAVDRALAIARDRPVALATAGGAAAAAVVVAVLLRLRERGR